MRPKLEWVKTAEGWDTTGGRWLIRDEGEQYALLDHRESVPVGWFDTIVSAKKDARERYIAEVAEIDRPLCCQPACPPLTKENDDEDSAE